MKRFGELLSQFITRAGMSDAELARRLGVSRQTIFRWREGLTDKPRNREDVLDIARALRISAKERDELLLSAGFSPERTSTEAPSILTTKSPALGNGRRKRWAIAVLGAGVSMLILLGLWLDSSRPPKGAPISGIGVGAAAPGETLILVSPFASYSGEQTGFNVAGRLQETLSEEFATVGSEGIRIEVLDAPVADELAAREIGDRLGAQFIVWGEYDSGRVIALVTPLGDTELSTTQERRWLLSTEGELLPTINSDLPDEVRWLALYILGQSQLQSGQLDEAQASLERALSLRVEEPSAMGGVYFQLGLLESRRESVDLNKVIALYTEALQLQPGHVSALNNRAIAYLERDSAGDLERAETDLRSAVRLTSSEPLYLTNLALALARRGSEHLDETLDLLRQAEQLMPDSASIQNSLCWFHSLDGSPAQGLPHCDRAVQRDASGYSNDSRGLALALLGRFDEAVDEFQFFLDRLEQDNPAAYDLFSSSRLNWIVSLKEGQSPFDETVLQELLSG